MKRNVNISLISTQYDGENTEKIELMTEGQLQLHRNGYELSYNETEASGMEGTLTRLMLTGDRLELRRTGGMQTELVLEKGKKHHCHYGTPFGDLFVGVQAKNIVSNITADGGRLDFCYVLDVNSSFVGKFEINIDVKPTDQQ